MSRKGQDKLFNNKVESFDEVWTDFGTLISKFTKISRINARKAQLTLMGMSEVRPMKQEEWNPNNQTFHANWVLVGSVKTIQERKRLCRTEYSRKKPISSLSYQR